MALLAIPSTVIWSYSVGGVVLAIGLVTIFLRGHWQKARGLDKLILFGPLFYAAPLAAFGTEHFTLTPAIASIVPKWIPWHLFWAYFVGACFIAAALSLVTGIQSRLSASLLALTFFLFVVLMDAPAWAEVWNSQSHPNCKEYGLFEVGRSHLGNPGVIVGREPRFLLQGMNLALHLCHLVV
jgi:uncharacterized membrane protein